MLLADTQAAYTQHSSAVPSAGGLVCCRGYLPWRTLTLRIALAAGDGVYDSDVARLLVFLAVCKAVDVSSLDVMRSLMEAVCRICTSNGLRWEDRELTIGNGWCRCRNVPVPDGCASPWCPDGRPCTSSPSQLSWLLQLACSSLLRPHCAGTGLPLAHQAHLA